MSDKDFGAIDDPSANEFGAIDDPSAQMSGMDWSKVSEGVESLPPTDFISKMLQLAPKNAAQGAAWAMAPQSQLGSTIGKMLPTTMNQFGMALVGGPALNEMTKGILTVPGVGRAIQWAADKIGLDTPALSNLVQIENSKVARPGPIAPAGSEELSNMSASNYVDKAIKLRSVMGEKEPDIAIGNKIMSILQKNSQIARQAASAPFDAAQQIAQDSTIAAERPDNLAAAVREIGLLHENVPPSLRLGKLGAFLRDESNLNPQGKLMNVVNAAQVPSGSAGAASEATKRSLPELLAIRQELAGYARAGNSAFGTQMPGLAGQTTPTSKFFYDLVDAADKDIADMSEGTKLGETLDAARAGWKTFKETYSNPFIESLMKKNPSEISKAAFSSPENINALSDAGGESALSLVRKGVMNDIVNQGASGLGNTNIRNPNAVLDRLLVQKPDEMERLFMPSHLDALRAFAGARQQMLQSLPNVGETSTTAAQKAIAIGAKFLPPQGKIALRTLKAMGAPLGVAAGIPMMQQSAQQNGFNLGQSLPPDQLAQIQAMKARMQ